MLDMHTQLGKIVENLRFSMGPFQILSANESDRNKWLLFYGCYEILLGMSEWTRLAYQVNFMIEQVQWMCLCLVGPCEPASSFCSIKQE